MPNSIKELLDTTGVGDDGLSESTREPGSGTDVGIGRGGIGVQSGPQGRRANVGVGGDGIGVHYGNNGSVGVRPGPNPFVYNYAASKDQLKDDPNVALFFLEKDLHKRKEMSLNFTKREDQKSTFLPREVANSIPFSSDKLPQIYDEFSVKPGSQEAETMKQTINECENKGIKGEEKYCATSLESMVDFSTKNLGNKVKAVSTDANESSPLQKYKIEDVKRMNGTKAVVCHMQNYVYAVFYCHKTQHTRAYVVSMVGEDKSKVNAVVVCHTDTAKWNPKHLAFQVLKVKPGTVPVCHFLPEDHVVWVPY
ncbi:BURP domain protein RD22-like isoform X2 [Rutidosis leptorrhynchoides]